MPASPKHGIWILFVAMLAGACDDSPTPDVGGVVDAGMPPASDSGPPPAVDAGPPPEPVGSFAFDSGDSALTFGSAIAVAESERHRSPRA